MKKIKNISLALLGLLVLSGCKINSNSKVSFQNTFDYSILGGIGLLNSLDSSVSINTSNVKRSNALTSEEESIINNLKIAQNMVGGDVVKSEIKASSKEGYEFAYTLSSQDLSGNNRIYEFFYNEQKLNSDDAFESEWSLSGIVLLEGIEYKISGNREKEGNEEEVEFVVKLDEANYVIIEHESEMGEEEFSYTKIENGREVYETEVGYEKSLTGKIELEFSTEVEGKEQEYKFEFFDNLEGSFVKVKYENDNLEYRYLIKITKQDEEIKYEFVRK